MRRDEKILVTRQLSIPVDQNKSRLHLYICAFPLSQISFEASNLWEKTLNSIIQIYSIAGYEIEKPLESRLAVIIYGAFSDENSNTTNFLHLQVQLLHTEVLDEYGNFSTSYIENDDHIFRLPLIENIDELDRSTEVKRAHTFDLNEKMFEQIAQNDTVLRLNIYSNLPVSLPINLAYDPSPIDKSLGVIYAAIVLFGLYVMIIWEVVHRTFAAMVAS